jgi:hypothetical protein
MKDALIAALAELQRQLSKRITVIRVIVDPDGTESSRVLRGSFQGEKQ